VGPGTPSSVETPVGYPSVASLNDPTPLVLMGALAARMERRLPTFQVQRAPTVRLPIRTNRRNPNTPCPCGSGRKFKRCHGTHRGASR
jgi:hypothetical protein